MRPYHRYLEGFVLLLILYSLGTHFVELEFTNPEHNHGFFFWSEFVVAALFTIEYSVRWVASRRLRYPLEPMALVDLMAILPFYVGFLVDLRTLRLIRVFRILRLFKLYRYTDALQNIRNAFHRVRYEFAVIGFAVFTVGCVGSVTIFELERERQPEVFGRLSDAVWYTIATLTTVGYGDKVPVTGAGKLVAVVMMIAGLGLFGTFVSLVGSAFLEEIRKATSQPGKLAASEASAPPALAQITQTDFAPDRVLQAIRRDTSTQGEEVQISVEALRLLTLACLVMTAEREVAAKESTETRVQA